MSEPKAQLVDPQGNMNLPGMNATGVVTATSFDGISNSTVTGLTGSPNLNVGVVTATSFVGDGTGHAANLTGTPNLNLGLTTATSFIGDATGKAAGLTGTPNLNVGLVTATSFVGNVTGDVTGNITGLAGSVTPGVNLNVGVATGIQWHGDGSNLTGAGSSAYIAQEITASGDETIIDLSYGNLIYLTQDTDGAQTTVGFASTSPAEQITILRNPNTSSTINWNISYSTGGVDFDGTDDRLDTTLTSAPGTSDFTLEYWVKQDTLTDWQTHFATTRGSGFNVGTDASGDFVFFTSNAGGRAIEVVGAITTGVWYHWAFVRYNGTTTGYIDGVAQGSFSDSYDYSPTAASIGNLVGENSEYTNGVISNLRLVVGTALYTENFTPPSSALTNVTNTVLLCCQSTSDATAKAVGGTITATSSPTAGSQTVATSGSRSTGDYTITWPNTVRWKDGTTPTLAANARDAAFQIFHFTTADTGANYQAWEEMKNDSETFGLYGAGPTGYGALGINVSSGGYYSSPVQIPGTSWSSLAPTGFTASAIGALKSDGTFWVWGTTNLGILGLNVAGAGLGDSVSSPMQLGTETTWDNVCFGGNNSAGCMAVKTDGTLWSWGMNNYGTLGLNGLVQRSSPCQVGTDTTWKWVNYAGDDSIFAIKTNGTLWSWGGNSAGAAGQNTPATTPSLRSSPVQVGANTTWAFACGGRNGHTIATKTDGTLWCWGDNSKGALGLNESETGAPAWTSPQRSSPTQVGSGTDWNYDNAGKIAAGYQRAFAIKTDGTLYGWGRSHQGQLGLNEGGYKDYSSPVQIPGTNWATISSVSEVIATKTDGTLWTWGDGGPGTLLLNDRTDRSSPTQVPGTWSTAARGIMSNSPTFALKVE